MAEHCFFDYALPRSAALANCLTCEEATYDRVQEQWQQIISATPALAHKIEDVDSMICDADELASLIDETTDIVVRQALRMVAEMRLFTAGAGTPFTPSAASQAILHQADVEWAQQLDIHPSFTKWLLQADLVACARSTIIEALKRAPSEVIRHAVREVLSFREAFELAHGRVFR
jgi:hypothetical protein